jgi:amino acid transporter
MLKRVMVGRPLASEEMDHQRIPKWIGLPVFSSDAISSTAYATEEILFVTALGASSLVLGLSKLVPIAMAVAVLLAIVVFSYRQTIFAYPNGGGSYMVSKDHLGEMPSLVAAASLLVDYVLVVAVSISAGVAAIISIPTFQGLADHRVLLCLGLIAFVTIINLRGMKESGKVFAFPTYIYIFSLGAMLAIGLFRSYFGDIEQVPFNPERFDGLRETGGSLGLFLLLRGFSSGAVALSGVEAISDGVPAFRKPQAKNAATTLLCMAAILGSLFFAVSVLAHHLHPYPTHEETVLSQMSRVVIGEGPFYWVLQFATAGILILAANTAYADFPRLSSFIARDGYLPRQFMNRGDRLVFSNGVVFLAVAAAGLIVAFGGVTTALIPLYAIGVFTSFTLSQSGMVRRHLSLRQPGWRAATLISGFGAAATGIVALIVGVTKFTIGAWVPIVVVPAIIFVFKAIKRHYDAPSPSPWSPRKCGATTSTTRSSSSSGGCTRAWWSPSTTPGRCGLTISSPSTSPPTRGSRRRCRPSGSASASTSRWRSSTPAIATWWRPWSPTSTSSTTAGATTPSPSSSPSSSWGPRAWPTCSTARAPWPSSWP